MLSLSKVSFCLAIFCVLLKSISCKTVAIKDGMIKGSTMKTRLGETFNAFRGIPYGEPPIGALRFLAPRPKLPWNGILNCTDFGPRCMQPALWYGAISEDCLHLNVFTKDLPTNGRNPLKPVIVFLHGGGFEIGSAGNHGPEYLMEREVVLVTVSYRLGTFGFMAIETRDIPGNAGLKDQNLALKWIQRNIQYFGGDATRVTIAGLSAGAYGATAHVVSPMSKGLFSNVIAMSGALSWQMNLTSNNLNFVKDLAAKVNCSFDNIDIMTECLRNVSLTSSDC